MRTGAIAYLGGILLLLQLPELPDVRWCLLLLPLIPLLLLAGKLRILLVFFCGFLSALWHANFIISRTIPVELEGRDLAAIGVISSLPERSELGSRFHFFIEKLSVDDEIIPVTGKVRLSWYGQTPVLVSGDRWQLTMRLKHPHGLMNPGGFDYEAWLLQNRLVATGYVRKGDNQRLEAMSGGYSWQAMRHKLSIQLEQVLKGSSHAGIVTALAIGERHAMSDAQWNVLMRTGTNHLIAISGLHIGLVAGLGMVLMRRLWTAVPWLLLR